LVRYWIANNASEEGINTIIEPESKGKEKVQPTVSKEKARSELFRLATFMGSQK
jgi:hypothetical protein